MPIEFILLSACLNLGFAVAAIVLLVLALRALDLLAGFRFREWLQDENTHDHAKAFYFGCRIIAGAIVVSGVLSVPI